MFRNMLLVMAGVLLCVSASVLAAPSVWWHGGVSDNMNDPNNWTDRDAATAPRTPTGNPYDIVRIGGSWGSEDLDGNGTLDPGEDLNGNGVINDLVPPDVIGWGGPIGLYESNGELIEGGGVALAVNPVLSETYMSSTGTAEIGWVFVLNAPNILTLTDGALLISNRDNSNLRNGGRIEVQGRAADGGPSLILAKQFRIAENGSVAEAAAETSQLRINGTGWVQVDPALRGSGAAFMIGTSDEPGTMPRGEIIIEDQGRLELLAADTNPYLDFGNADTSVNQIILRDQGELWLPGDPNTVGRVGADNAVTSLDAMIAMGLIANDQGCALTVSGADPVVVKVVLPSVGLVVENPDQLMGFEPQMLARLESLGYAVELIRGDDVKNEVFTMADAEALDVIVVSEAISSSDMNKLVGADVPIMNGEGYGWHKMNFAEDGTQDWQDANDLALVVDDTHPIVVDANLALGTIDFLMHESATTTTAQVAVLAPGAVSLVSMVIDGNDYALVFAIDKGAELAKGAGPAVNRIVGFSLPGNQEGVLSDAGWALFDAAIRWLDPAPVEIPPMVAHWPMDEGAGTLAADVVGGNDGTLVGGVTWIAEGGVHFDDIDGSHIEVPHADVLDFGDVDFSISMMVRYPTPPTGTDRWIIKGTHSSPGTGSRYEVFHTSGSTVRFSIDNGPANAKSKLEVPEAAFVTGEWVHVVAVRDAANDLIAIYADGVLQGTVADGSGDISNGEPLWIGESTDEAETAMSGDIADVRIFSEALTEAEIVAIY